MRAIGKAIGALLMAFLSIWLILYKRFEELFLWSQLRSLEHILDRELGKQDSRGVISGVKERYMENARRRPVSNRGVMRMHGAIMMFGLALHGALGQNLDEGVDPVEETHRLMWSAIEHRLRFSFYGLGRSRDPFGQLVRWYPYFNTYIYPSPFWEKKDVEVDGGIGTDITKCPVHDFFTEEGVPELTKAFCDFDLRIAELYPPQIDFHREGTLATGADRCDFRYYRR